MAPRFAMAGDCDPQVTSISAAPAREGGDTDAKPPAQDWRPVSLPDKWTRRWPDHDGSVWYRIDWHRPCATDEMPVALVIESLNMAGEVYVNDDLLWRDEHLAEPLSRSWTLPRQWVLPASALRPGNNILWVRVHGRALLSPGLGRLALVPLAQAHGLFRAAWWELRASTGISLAVSLLNVCLFGGIWLLYRRQKVHAWFVLSNLAWIGFIWNMLATETWPFPDSLTASRFSLVGLVLHVACFRMSIRYLQSDATPAAVNRIEVRCLMAWAIIAAVALVATPDRHLGIAIVGAWFSAIAIYLLTCLGTMVRALRIRTRENLLLGSIALLFVFVVIHDALLINGKLGSNISYAPFAGLLLTLVIAGLLASRVARGMRRIEHFNHELAAAVDHARSDVEAALRHERDLAVANSRLQERLSIAYDLHDGLGSTISRSITLGEQSHDVDGWRERHLSTLRSLRDDLRQVLDSSNAPAQQVADTPVAWAAPLRHRFSTLFEAMGIRGHWQLPVKWSLPPSAMQGLTLARVLEEALTNVMKHSGARQVRIEMIFPETSRLELHVADDGRGFDTTLGRAGPGLGLHSMQARLERIGGRLEILSTAAGTRIIAHVRIGPGAGENSGAAAYSG